MSKLVTYTFARGETILVGLAVEQGTMNMVTGVTARLRRLPDDGGTTLDPDAPVAATFLPTERQAEGDIPAGWNLMIPSATSLNIPAGAYLADARLGVGSGFNVTDPIRIEIYEPATV